MKPRNRFEKYVMAQSEKLRPISKIQKEWAFSHCIEHYAFRLSNGRITCMDCGHSWIMVQQKDICTCPKCKAELKVCNTKKRKCQQKQYFTLLDTSGEFQILRMFLLVAVMWKGNKAQCYVFEIGHYWWNAAGRKAIVAIQRTWGRYVDSFLFSSPLCIRNDNDAYRYVASAPIFPKFKTIEILKRNGFEDDFHDIVPTRLIPALLSDPKAETLLKAGQYNMLRHYLHSVLDIGRYWQSIKICIRNGYTIQDCSTWCDMIDMLRHFGKDISNSKVVCPADLKAEHDILMQKRTKQEKRRLLMERMAEAARYEQEYRKLKGKFFGIVITDEILEIKVLESVAEFVEEGTAMHHCVWENKYYLKENSLILSATISGERIETIEVSLKTFKVIQSRGICNSFTKYHKKIIKLVNSNMEMIRRRTKSTA